MMGARSESTAPHPMGEQPVTTTLTDLIARWDSGDGKPYKGSLIDFRAYADDPDNLGCMCAQGQVLHVLGGWEPEKLRDTDQRDADRETAKLLNISTAHAVLLRSINDKVDGAPSIVLTDPAKVLGDQAHIVLAFWLHFDRMTGADWLKVAAAGAAAGDAAWDAARATAGAAAGAAAGDAAWDAAGAAAGDAAGAAARAAAWAAAGAAAGACSEIQGARILRERGQPFFFLPMFGFATPEEIPALPADYGKAA